MKAPGQRVGSVLAPAVLALAILAGTASAATAARSPQAILNALLASHPQVMQLPHGYNTPIVSAYAVPATAKAHHAIGGAEIYVDGGQDAVIYLVFTSAADAKADWLHGGFAGTSTTTAPVSIPQPSLVLNGSTIGPGATGASVSVGLTKVACLFGPLIIQSITTSTASTKHGDVAGAVALELFGVQLLGSIG